MEQLIKENYLFIYNYALRLSCHPQDAEDLTQQTFLSAYEKYDQLREQGALRKWLEKICYNHFLMMVRSRGVREESVEEINEAAIQAATANITPSPEEEVIVADEIKGLQNGCFMAMVRRLSLKQRIAFSLVDMFGMGSDEVAELLEISPNALKGLLFRARMNLDSFYDGHCNLIQENNPCSCAAWIQFRDSHENNKSKMKKTTEYLDYRQKGYKFDPEVRGKVSYLYEHMTEKKPSDEWFQKVISLFEKN